jgi:hypothetical protein
MYDWAKSVDVLPEFLCELWKTVLSDEHLVIPSLKKMQSKYRSDEVKNRIFNQFIQETSNWKDESRYPEYPFMKEMKTIVKRGN